MQHPSLQTSPGQHGEPTAPQVTHWPVLQMVPPAVHKFPLQQGCPCAPQVLQMLLPSQPVAGSLQTESLAALAQQACPSWPHSRQMWLVRESSYRHCVPASEQLIPLQHGPPVLPHAIHLFDAHARLPEQPVPLAKVPLGQQPSPSLPQVQRPDVH
jgi:hypothetical protein